MTTGRRFSLYFSWSRPAEIDVDLGVLNNRFPTLFEFRRAIWPLYEWASEPGRFRQDVAGFLDHVVLFDFQRFSELITEATGQSVSLIQRVDNQPPVQELDESFLSNVDTLIVVSLDHARTEQRPSEGEIHAIRHFLEREDTCLIVCPHHWIGAEENQRVQESELKHHGDRLVPPQQLLGGFGITLLQSLGVWVENQWGLNPAKSPDQSPAPLRVRADLDGIGILRGVQTFNLHPHLPHLYVRRVPNIAAVTRQAIRAAGPGPERVADVVGNMAEEVRVLAQQEINPAAESHPFVQAGNRFFNALVWVPPRGRRAGNIYVCDATLWSSAFGGVKSLETFWKNLAGMGRS
jgi:hypothetical protein